MEPAELDSSLNQESDLSVQTRIQGHEKALEANPNDVASRMGQIGNELEQPREVDSSFLRKRFSEHKSRMDVDRAVGQPAMRHGRKTCRTYHVAEFVRRREAPDALDEVVLQSTLREREAGQLRPDWCACSARRVADRLQSSRQSWVS